MKAKINEVRGVVVLPVCSPVEDTHSSLVVYSC